MSIKEKALKISKFIWWVINPVSGATFIDRIMPPGGKRRIEYDKKQTEKKYAKKVENYFKLADEETAEFWKGIDHRKYLKYEKDLKKAEDDELSDYEKWIRNNSLSDQELEMQSKKRFKIRPKISIVIPLYNTNTEFFRELLYSVHCQTYSNWELCLADGSPEELTEIKKMCEKDKRIKYKFLGENKGISGNTNEALSLATGKYISLLDHDDMLSIDALYEVVKVINENKDVDFIYSDEDKFHFLDEPRYSPHFKPDYAPDTLRSNNYICHYSVLKKELLDKIGGFDNKYDGAQDYDLILRATENAKKIVHISKILYHWRVHKGSTSMETEAKPYAIDAGKRAIEDHLKRLSLKGKVTKGKNAGTYIIDYELKDNPKVSILINNASKKCIDEILKNTSYENYEILAFGMQEKIENEKVKNIDSNEKNYSKLINENAKNIKDTEYLVVLDTNCILLTQDWIQKMLGFVQREDVGVVGAKTYYQDDTICNAGIVVGAGKCASNLFEGINKNENGYFGREKIIQNMNAVSGLCMMIDINVFREVGGFSEEFSNELNDVDFCLKIRKLKKLIVYNSEVQLLYLKDKQSNTISDSDVNRFNEKWKEKINVRDEYYNQNFSLKNAQCEIDCK